MVNSIDHVNSEVHSFEQSTDMASTICHLPLKRAFDIAFSLSVLTLLAPVYLTLAMIVKLSSRGPAIYYQERIGRGGVPFKCYKFRSMYPDADKRLSEILANDPAKRSEWEQLHKLKCDPRITPIGKILRKTSLDEFPQFWNVLKGDLSVVGPRPVVREEIEKHYGERAQKVLSIRPGITGLWQISGRSEVSYAQRIAMDEKYVQTRSLILDCKIIARTIPSMISRIGAY